MIFCVLGLGSIGRRHAGNLRRLGQEVIGFDPSPESRERFRQEGGNVARSREAGIDEAGAVVIASPNSAHADDLRDAIDAGIHVFVEKPMAHRMDDVPALIERAKALGLVVYPGLNQRFNPAVKAGRQRLADGAIGTPLWSRFTSASYLPDWRPDTDYRSGYAADARTGGVLFDLLHEFDMAYFLLGAADIVCAAAHRTGLLDIASEDCADVVLRHQGGSQTTLHLDYVTRPALRRIEVAGTDGWLEIDVRGRRMQRTAIHGEQAEDRRYDSSPTVEYQAEMAQFLDCITEGAEPACPASEAVAVLQQVIAARAMCGLPSA